MVGKKKYSYTKSGVAAAKKAATKTGKPMRKAPEKKYAKK